MKKIFAEGKKNLSRTRAVVEPVGQGLVRFEPSVQGLRDTVFDQIGKHFQELCGGFLALGGRLAQSKNFLKLIKHNDRTGRLRRREAEGGFVEDEPWERHIGC